MLYSFNGFSQSLKCEVYRTAKIIRLDTIPVEGSSISIEPHLTFSFSPEKNAITIHDDNAPDSLRICYRAISSKFFDPIFNRDIKTYSTGGVRTLQDQVSVKRTEEDALFSFGQVESYGAITRGVTFGNRQNVFVNSSLNLQMDGALSDNLKVSAVITDQNIPYQPEGNTQQIRDFDNVFIKLYNDDFEIIAGDIVLQNPIDNSYFMKYYKNVQGLALKYNYTLNDVWKARSMVTGSLAKGQFSSAVIEPIEGVQGPYKLRGPNGERFIIVLANSERVYLDGQPLERGFDRDYVIDYNLGEITFSSKVVITRFSRIRVDYEYADQFYTRSNITATQEITNGRAALYFNYYREKDNPSSTLGFDLDEGDLNALRQSGDNNGLALINGADSVGFVEHGVPYEKIDIVDTDGNPAAIYQYSTDKNTAIFRVSFSEVGLGAGDYQLTSSTANGRIYEWISPVNGQSQGNFAPVRVIPTPNQKQMIVAGARLKITSHEEVFQELAISSNDQNLYSIIDDGDNSGYAWRGGVSSADRTISFLPAYKWNSALTFETNHRNFKAIDRFRSVDFDRDWSYNVFSDSVNRQDQILNLSTEWIKDTRNAVRYDFSYRNRNKVIKGTQHLLIASQKAGPFVLRTENFLLNNEPSGFQSRWWRSSQMIKLDQWFLQPGYEFTMDQNTTSLADPDSVINTLMHFTAHDFFIETPDTSQTRLRLDFIKRRDKLPVSGELLPYTEAEEVKLGMSTSLFETQQIGMQINFRKVKELTGEKNTEQNLLGRVDWTGSFIKSLVRSNLTYSTANTRELKREYIFLNVATGEGTHTWRDENADGVQDINEFYEAINVDEKNYIKLFTPTDEYIKAFQTTYIHTMDAQFPSNWRLRNGVLGTLAKISFNTSLKYNYKTTDSNPASRLNPFQVDLYNPEILFARNLTRLTLFYNRNAPGFGFDVARTDQTGKSLLSNGFELSEKKDWFSSVRVLIGRGFTIRARSGIGQTSNLSDVLNSRNFTLLRNTIGSELIWQPVNSFRVITGAERRGKTADDAELPGNSEILEYKVEITWISAGKGNLNATFNWINIDFEGTQNTFLGYELLEALQPGSNQRWRVNWQQSLGKGLQLSLQYTGRKSSENRAVHTGTAQVTAFF